MFSSGVLNSSTTGTGFFSEAARLPLLRPYLRPSPLAPKRDIGGSGISARMGDGLVQGLRLEVVSR